VLTAAIGGPADGAEPVTAVPFVGCPVDGQGGPLDAPTSGSTPTLPAHLARRLAFYADGSRGVLAPRDWHCAALFGSSGSTLVVAPQAITPDSLLRNGHRSLGSAIVLRTSFGGTSGRFHVARVAARLFPRAQPFVQRVIDEGIVPKDQFPSRPYRADTLVRRSDFDVEFTTPARRDGLGTDLGLAKNDQPIAGIAILLPDGDYDLVMATLRLPPAQRDLVPPILAAVGTEIGGMTK
jgi:hypothetical protein